MKRSQCQKIKVQRDLHFNFWHKYFILYNKTVELINFWFRIKFEYFYEPNLNYGQYKISIPMIFYRGICFII